MTRAPGSSFTSSLQATAVLLMLWCGQAAAQVGSSSIEVNPIADRVPLAREDHFHHEHAADHNMKFDDAGMVMNSNADVLPQDCESISEDVEFVVYAGVDYALSAAGRTFGYSEHEYHVPPCSRVTIHFYNEDQVRHQWMLHGLPRYLYPQGMFHLEASGGQHVMGTFIVPSDDATYLIHCDITQHMEKGMKAQLVVGAGSGDLWSVPGVSADFNHHEEKMPRGTLLLMAAMVMLAGAMLTTTKL
ncbi:MAG: multicopper oxidase domain-containing protein [Gammaproteobacteria bacterium]|nr:multicopper oxidase domain-containing protein [Gammaproteobacteria bacterium]MDP2347504.1 multicopper oxidase domain-containing protein [Gammaproteobacteria bacterium]